jgi:hypothetical protein
MRGPTRYEIVVQGELSDRFAGAFGDVFEDVCVRRLAGKTVIAGDVIDQADLHGLLERIQDLGFDLVSVNPVAEPESAREPQGRR